MRGKRLKTITRVCTSCDGVGLDRGYEDDRFYYLEEDCTTCHGAGTIEVLRSRGYRLSEPGPVCMYHESAVMAI